MILFLNSIKNNADLLAIEQHKSKEMFVAFAALVCANEVEDGEQTKRGAGKASSLNSIPTGAQKPEYTYQVYNQNHNSQTSPSSYQAQVPNSFYPSQSSNQYYTIPNQPAEVSSGYSPQPQISLIPPPTPSQFLPINFVPNAGYQSKYQIIPSKAANGNIQLLIQPPQSYQSNPFLQYPQSYFSPNPGNQINSQQGQFQLSPQGQYNVAPQYQSLPLSQPYLGQPSTMLLLAQPNPYNSLLYPGQNPAQSFYNYYPSSAQQKYNLSYGSSPPPLVEYEKVQGPVSQSLPKEDNDIGSHGSDFVSSDSSASYKTAYATGRSCNLFFAVHLLDAARAGTPLRALFGRAVLRPRASDNHLTHVTLRFYFQVALVCVLALAVAADKKIELQDIEEDNLKSEQEKEVDKSEPRSQNVGAPSAPGLLPLDFFKNGLLRYFENQVPQQPRYVQQYAVTEPPERPPTQIATPKSQYGAGVPQQAMVGYLSNIPMQIYLVPQYYNENGERAANTQPAVQYAAPPISRVQSYPSAPEGIQPQNNFIEVPTYVTPSGKTYIQQPVAYVSYAAPSTVAPVQATVAPMLYQVPVVQYPTALAAPPVVPKGYYPNSQYSETNNVEEVQENEVENPKEYSQTETSYTKPPTPEFPRYYSSHAPFREEQRHTSISELPPPNPLLLKGSPPHLSHIPKALPIFRPLSKPVYAAGGNFISSAYSPKPSESYGNPYKRRPMSLLDSYVPSGVQLEYLKRGYVKDPLVAYEALSSGRNFPHYPVPRHYERGFLPNQMYHTAAGGITYASPMQRKLLSHAHVKIDFDVKRNMHLLSLELYVSSYQNDEVTYLISQDIKLYFWRILLLAALSAASPAPEPKKYKPDVKDTKSNSSLTNEEKHFLREVEAKFGIKSDLPFPAVIAIEIVNDTDSKSKGKRTIDANLGYGYRTNSGYSYSYFGKTPEKGKFVLYPYSQEDIPPAHGSGQNNRYTKPGQDQYTTSSPNVEIQPSQAYELVPVKEEQETSYDYKKPATEFKSSYENVKGLHSPPPPPYKPTHGAPSTLYTTYNGENFSGLSGQFPSVMPNYFVDSSQLLKNPQYQNTGLTQDHLKTQGPVVPVLVLRIPSSYLKNPSAELYANLPQNYPLSQYLNNVNLQELVNQYFSKIGYSVAPQIMSYHHSAISAPVQTSVPAPVSQYEPQHYANPHVQPSYTHADHSGVQYSAVQPVMAKYPSGYSSPQYYMSQAQQYYQQPATQQQYEYQYVPSSETEQQYYVGPEYQQEITSHEVPSEHVSADQVTSVHDSASHSQYEAPRTPTHEHAQTAQEYEVPKSPHYRPQQYEAEQPQYELPKEDNASKDNGPTKVTVSPYTTPSVLKYGSPQQEQSQQQYYTPNEPVQKETLAIYPSSPQSQTIQKYHSDPQSGHSQRYFYQQQVGADSASKTIVISENYRSKDHMIATVLPFSYKQRNQNKPSQTVNYVTPVPYSSKYQSQYNVMVPQTVLSSPTNDKVSYVNSHSLPSSIYLQSGSGYNPGEEYITATHYVPPKNSQKAPSYPRNYHSQPKRMVRPEHKTESMTSSSSKKRNEKNEKKKSS
ncbi:hypothetical protein MSG28_004615 [Choristoneura fumiferana]|uniref:Uncharacterized protein n=1 Tax=Choristoneura fumiferana TaxID=7141 RepID=A0ACC0K795_CHOFU|nr:hypothetical protein MSG28_004615 [Choristoneura fumiferana]